MRCPTMMQCPACLSYHIKRNGRTHNGKQNHKCKRCNRQFVYQPTKKYIDEHTRTLIDRMLLERISLRGITRVVEVSLRWLMTYITAKYEQTPEPLNAEHSPGGAVLLMRYTSEIDELWSFVGKKVNQQWLWVAQDIETRQIVAYHVGSREAINAQRLYQKLPKRYRLRARFYTDKLEA